MSVVDVDTGEIIPAGALAKPDITRPGEPISLARITSQCRSIEVWAEHCDSIPDITDARNKLAAIEQYVASTSKDGRALIAAAQRRLEIRIGILLGPAKVGAHSSATEGSDLSKDERSEFRKMADHPEVVEAVIDDSDDQTPASRRRTLDEINRAKQTEPAKPTAPRPTAKQELHRLIDAIEDLRDEFRDDGPADFNGHQLADALDALLADFLMKDPS